MFTREEGLYMQDKEKDVRDMFIKLDLEKVEGITEGKGDMQLHAAILGFIFDFWTNQGIGSFESEAIRKTFKHGYCYYFAQMLKDAFPNGKVCWAKPTGHIVYVYEGVPYDIEGVYIGNVKLVSYTELCDTLEQFRHRGRDDELDNEMLAFAYRFGITVNELDNIIWDMVSEEARKQSGGNKEGVSMMWFRHFKKRLESFLMNR